MIRAAAVLVAATAAVAPAHAGTPDPSVGSAGDANLEPESPRRGVAVTLAFGGGMTLGIGVDNATGRGGAGLLRIAHVATPRTQLTIELATSALFREVRFGMGPDANTELLNDEATNLLVGAQYYVNPALWLRAGAGLGRYRADAPSGQVGRRLAGPASSFGAGIDVLRWSRVRLGLEITSTAMLTREGILSASGLLLGVTID